VFVDVASPIRILTETIPRTVSTSVTMMLPKRLLVFVDVATLTLTAMGTTLLIASMLVMRIL
jgi:hypothetical protein